MRNTNIIVPPNTFRNPLNAGSLTTFIASNLPKDITPQLKNPLDAIALIVYAKMLAIGFRLVGLREVGAVLSKNLQKKTIVGNFGFRIGKLFSQL